MTTRTLTTAAGAPVGDNQKSQTAGSRGPVTLQDFWLIEKLAHFDRWRDRWDLVLDPHPPDPPEHSPDPDPREP